MKTPTRSYILARPSSLLGTLSALALAFVAVIPMPAYAGGGNVLPPNSKPHGYSLTDMAEELARFSTSGNAGSEYPSTPFQILYITGDNVFGDDPDEKIKTGTKFFVPLAWVSDSVPILGDFPDDSSTDEEVQDYFFDKEQLGVRDLAIEVDGKVTSIGREYLAGPVSHPDGLLPDGGSHFIQVGVFLTPLSKGTHTVTISGVFDGDLLIPYLGDDPVPFETTYTVIVK